MDGSVQVGQKECSQSAREPTARKKAHSWCDVSGCGMGMGWVRVQGEPLNVLDNGFHAMGDGAAHDALLNANIHLLTFLAGIPNAGPGLLLPPEEQVCPFHPDPTRP